MSRSYVQPDHASSGALHATFMPPNACLHFMSAARVFQGHAMAGPANSPSAAWLAPMDAR